MSQRGATLVEVLITMVILLVGLLGLVALQARLQIAQIDTYQRAQASLLLNDMTQRIATNRIHAGAYVTTGAIGTGTANCDTLANANARVQSDLREWCSLLQGASEANGNIRLGGLVGGRGCVEQQVAGRVYRVTVAWQGLAPVIDVDGATNTQQTQCGVGAYDGGASCTDDQCRRVLTTTVHIGKLT